MDVDPLAHRDDERAQIVDAMRVVGVRMGHQDAVETSRPPASSNCSRRSGEVSTSTWVLPSAPARSTSTEQRRRRLRGLFGIASAPALRDARHAARGAAAQYGERKAQARLSIAGILANSRSVLARVAAAIAASSTPLTSASTRAVSVDEGRLVALAAMGNRREERRVGLDQQAVERHVARDRRADSASS